MGNDERKMVESELPLPSERVAEIVHSLYRPQGRVLRRLKKVVTIAQQAEDFVASDHFRVSRLSLVRINEVDADFRRWFKQSRDEPQKRGQILVRYVAQSIFDDTQIVAALGGRNKAEVRLVDLFSLLERQPNGERGFLRTDNELNVFYVEDDRGILRRVMVSWWNGDHLGWLISALEIGSADPLGPRHRVLAPFPEDLLMKRTLLQQREEEFYKQ